MENNLQLLIPKNINFRNKINNNFEIYLSGKSTKGALMIGKDLNHLYDRESTFPKFLKFTRENIPLPLQDNETIQFVSCGLQHVILITNYSKCYLFGDLKYGSYQYSTFNDYGVKPQDLHFGVLLPFRMNDFTICDQLSCKITHLDSSEVFSIVRDELNRYWYCGKSDFASKSKVSYEFKQLDNGELILNGNSVVTHFVIGGRHVVVCVDKTTLYTIGSNHASQLGKGCDNSFKEFKKVNWNEDKQYIVKQIALAATTTIILTSKYFIFELLLLITNLECGKLFSTFKSLSNSFCSFQYIQTSIIFKDISSSWDFANAISESGIIYAVDKGAIKELDLCGFNIEEQNYKLFSGTFSPFKYFGIYFDYRFTALEFNEGKYKAVSINTNLPIVNTRLTGELKLVFCVKNSLSIDNFQMKLYKCKGFKDIKFL